MSRWDDRREQREYREEKERLQARDRQKQLNQAQFTGERVVMDNSFGPAHVTYKMVKDEMDKIQSAQQKAWAMTPDEIQNLPMDEYQKLRRELLVRAKEEVRFREIHGQFPNAEDVSEMFAVEAEEAERLALIEELKRQQNGNP